MSERTNPNGIIRIVLVEVPNLMAAVLNDAIANDKEMQIVARVQSAPGSNEGLQNCDFDVIVTTLKAGERVVPPSIQQLLFDSPHASVVVFSCRGQRMEIFDRNVLREVTAEQVREMIRDTKARSA